MSTHIIDERNPAVVFSPGWSQGGSGKEYNSTTTYTDSAGRNATLTFEGAPMGGFRGTHTRALTFFRQVLTSPFMAP